MDFGFLVLRRERWFVECHSCGCRGKGLSCWERCVYRAECGIVAL